MKAIGVKLTDKQFVVYECSRGDLTNAEYVRRLVAADCAGKGIDWPDDMAQHGGNRLRVCPDCGSFDIDDGVCRECGE